MDNEATIAARQQAKNFARTHLAECSTELLASHKGGALAADGKLHELARLCRQFTDNDDELRQAEHLIVQAALTAAAMKLPDTQPKPAVPGWIDPDHRD